MELTALIMDNWSKKAKQFSLPVELEYVASEFGYAVESESSDPKILESIDFDNCTLYFGVDTDYELGCHLESEFGLDGFSRDILERYFDYEKYGRDVRLEEGGRFVDKGYFVSK